MSKVVHSVSAPTILTSLWVNKTLVWQMTRREIIGRYQGSMLGFLWSFFHPILMLAVYTFVFSVVFQVRWGESTGTKTEFAMLLFAGLIVHSFFADCINRAPSLILSNGNFVKKVVFPLEILPWVELVSSLFHTVINVVVLLIFFLLVNHFLNWTVLLLPLIFLPFIYSPKAEARFTITSGDNVSPIIPLTPDTLFIKLIYSFSVLFLVTINILSNLAKKVIF